MVLSNVLPVSTELTDDSAASYRPSPGLHGAGISFVTIECLSKWLQDELGADAHIGQELQIAFDEQARRAYGPHKPAPAPFHPPAFLMDLLDSLPEHLAMQQVVSMSA